jgi:hypothetical protein
MVRGFMQLEFNIFNVMLEVDGTHTREMTAFLPEYKYIFPEKRLECSCRQISNKYVTEAVCGLGIWVLFFGRLVTLLLDKDVKQARNEISDLIWRTGTEPVPDPDAPA